METVYRFLATYEGLIYILLALGGLFAFRWLWKSWRELHESVFGLEREFAMRRLSQALAVSLLILVMFFGELFLASFVVPSLPSADLLATPTMDILSQTEGALSGSPSILLTALPPAADTSSTSGCVPGQLIITSPEPGQDVRGTVTLVGTVDIPNFGFYKYEVSPQGAEAWATVSAGREIVQNGDVGFWDTSTLTPGDYQLRLLVTDSQGQSYPPCVISVRVSAP
ncbi:MAG: hypothetical protein JW963_18775 [Anaerolineales bacterium]|nr:hypothetical protein [Anaerolineales bacterium]